MEANIDIQSKLLSHKKFSFLSQLKYSTVVLQRKLQMNCKMPATVTAAVLVLDTSFNMTHYGKRTLLHRTQMSLYRAALKMVNRIINQILIKILKLVDITRMKDDDTF
jgi:hypothetical protein